MLSRALLLCALYTLALQSLRSQTLDQALQEAAADYRARGALAAEELNRTRASVAAQKVPLLERLRAAQDRTLAAESEAARFEIRREDTTELRRKLLLELDAVRKTTGYVGTLAHDGMKAALDGLAPGEDQFFGEQMRALQQQLASLEGGSRSAPALDAVEFLLASTERAVGGYRMEGQATLAGATEVRKGTFAFVGPETFFRPADDSPAGLVRAREGAKYPVSHPLSLWPAGEAEHIFAGQPGLIPADATGGKALRLRETTGTVWEHIRKGGLVAFAIVGVGLLAVLLMLQKLRDVSRMTVDSPASVMRVLDRVAEGSLAAAGEAAAGLRPTTRELFLTGLRYADQPANVLEERLQAVLLEQRLHYERRLPLLAVIATAAPLMGLLGTVVGMVKTFALITVFGTGNAGKLSSGISEVLVATELGLAVAIPTLIVHGFLAHRIQRNLALLERYALQFTTAVGTPRQPSDPERVRL